MLLIKSKMDYFNGENTLLVSGSSSLFENPPSCWVPFYFYFETSCNNGVHSVYLRHDGVTRV